VFGLSGCGDDIAGPSGPQELQITDLRVGTGDEAVAGSTVSVDYTGWLWDDGAVDNKGTQFDTSAGRGPYTFVLGVGQVIAGWDEGVVGMREGGLRRLVIPSSLAYGNQGVGPIPPNSTLIFEVDLLEVQ
jgi:FKBP-type peptidyl-prolyl cis-trans isomerase FkpA